MHLTIPVINFPVARRLLLTGRLGSTVTFFTYAAFGVLTLVFILTKVPETKGKTLEEISKLWR